MPQRNILYTVNNLLALILFGLAVYLIVIPVLPVLSLIYRQNTDDTHGWQYQSQLVMKEASGSVNQADLKPIPSRNTLVIPKIGVDTEILDGSTENNLLKGIGRRLNTSRPDLGGNTVLVGHRFQYTSGPNTFYHLDKLSVGDKFLIFWEGKEYDYEVIEIKVVSPSTLEIENQTDENIVTLYTCTPLWTAQNRLVVVGRLLEL